MPVTTKPTSTDSARKRSLTRNPPTIQTQHAPRNTQHVARKIAIQISALCDRLNRTYVAEGWGWRMEDYRKRQRSRIVGKAREVARRVRKTGRQEALDPMSAFERKIVHDAVAEVGGLETASQGEEPNRRVIIRPAGG